MEMLTLAKLQFYSTVPHSWNLKTSQNTISLVSKRIYRFGQRWNIIFQSKGLRKRFSQISISLNAMSSRKSHPQVSIIISKAWRIILTFNDKTRWRKHIVWIINWDKYLLNRLRLYNYYRCSVMTIWKEKI